MKKRKKKRPAKGRKVAVQRDPDFVGATPETLAHAAAAPPDPILALVECSPPLLDSACERAIDEIRHVRNAIVYQLEAKSNRLDNRAHGVSEMSDEIAHAHQTRYLPWSRDIGRIVLDIVLKMIMEGVPPGIFERRAVDAIKQYARRLGA